MRFRKASCALAACLLAAPLQAQEVRLRVQISALAGFRYHAAPRLFEQLAPGQPLELVREPDNPYDANAVRVDWQGQKLGYVPRAENGAIAWAMDQGETIEARVMRRVERGVRPRNARRRIELEVFVR
jgi:hypothetical protein